MNTPDIEATKIWVGNLGKCLPPGIIITLLIRRSAITVPIQKVHGIKC